MCGQWSRTSRHGTWRSCLVQAEATQLLRLGDYCSLAPAGWSGVPVAAVCWFMWCCSCGALRCS